MIFWILFVVVGGLTLGIVAVACSRFTRRTEDQYVERFRAVRPHDNGNDWE